MTSPGEHLPLEDLRQALHEGMESLSEWPTYLDPDEVKDHIITFVDILDQRLKRLENREPEPTND